MTTFYIYGVRRIDTHDIYVGCTNDLAKRWNGHRCDLNTERHRNKRLQSDWLTYGAGAFELVVIDTVEGIKKDALRAEAGWIAQIGTYNEMVASKDGNGTTFSDRMRKNMAAHMKRRHAEGDPTIKEGLRKAQEIANANASDRFKKLWSDDSYVEWYRGMMRERWQDEGFRAKVMEGHTRFWSDPEAHIRHGAIIKTAWEKRGKDSGLPRGVTHSASKSKPFKASIWKNGKSHHLGVYATAEEAAEAYRTAG